MGIMQRYPLFVAPISTGNLAQDAAAFLEANGKKCIAEHSCAVANKAVELAGRFGLDADAAFAGAWLHDISGVLAPQEMAQYAIDHGWERAEAELRYPFLLHQRLSAVFAAQLFGMEDQRVLSMIGQHTTLSANPAQLDMALFLADKLAWDQPGEPPFLDAVEAALCVSLGRAARVYVEYVFDHGMILCPHPHLLAARAFLAVRYKEFI